VESKPAKHKAETGCPLAPTLCYAKSLILYNKALQVLRKRVASERLRKRLSGREDNINIKTRAIIPNMARYYIQYKKKFIIINRDFRKFYYLFCYFFV